MTKILLIDDDPDIRMTVRSMLQRNGYWVATASGRPEALECIAESRPNIILLDVLLSGADGRDLCRDLKNEAGTGDIPVIMFSAHPAAAVDFENYGASDFIVKPFTSAALLEKLLRHIPEVK